MSFYPLVVCNHQLHFVLISEIVDQFYILHVEYVNELDKFFLQLTELYLIEIVGQFFISHNFMWNM
jgi:hypothetical protein